MQKERRPKVETKSHVSRTKETDEEIELFLPTTGAFLPPPVFRGAGHPQLAAALLATRAVALLAESEMERFLDFFEVVSMCSFSENKRRCLLQFYGRLSVVRVRTRLFPKGRDIPTCCIAVWRLRVLVPKGVDDLWLNGCFFGR